MQLTAEKYGKGLLCLLDTDSTLDKCPDPIWLLGLQRPGPQLRMSISRGCLTDVLTEWFRPYAPRQPSTVTAAPLCSSSNALSTFQTSSIARYCSQQNSMQVLRDASGSHIAPTSTLSDTHHLPSSNVNRPRQPVPVPQRQSPPALRQNVGGRVAKGMEE